MPPDTDPRPPGIWATTVRWCWRHRSELAPAWLAFAVLALGITLRLVLFSWPTFWALALVNGLTLAAAGGLWQWGERAKLDRAIERAYAAGLTLAIGLWLALGVALSPMQPPLLLALLVGTLVGGGPWWWHRRVRHRTEQGIAAWRADLEAHEEGSRVGRPRFDQSGGVAIPWNLKPGRVIDDILPAVQQLESLLDLRPGAIEVDQDPTRARRVVLRIQPRDPHAAALEWPGPPQDATITRPVVIGRYTDGAPCQTPLLGMHALIAGATGSGKALALDTPIPTPTGWTTMGWLRAGDQVFDEQGQPCTVVATSEIQHDRTCYKVVFSDGSAIVADAEHRWFTATREARLSERKYRTRRLGAVARDQADRRVLPAVVTTEQIRATLIAKSAGSRPHANHSIPLAKPLQYPASDLAVDPYVLGVWLGDGRTRDAVITTADPEILAEIRAAGYEVSDAHATRRQEKASSHTIGSGLKVALRLLNVIGDKHIPRDYLHGSPAQRLALLQGLMDTDGTVTKTGSCEFMVTNRVLAEQALELIIGLGIKAKLRTRPVRWKGKDCGTAYRIQFTTGTPVFRLPRKLVRQNQATVRSTQQQRYIIDVRPVPSVPVRCIQVDSPSHLYLAGRGCIPTHNSGVLNVVVGYLAACPDVVLWGCDLKFGLELGPWRPVFAPGRVATTPDQAAELLEAAVRVIGARGELMARQALREWPTSPERPALVVVIDEHKALSGSKRAIAAIETITAQGRAMAVSVADSTQYPTVGALGSQLIAPQCVVKVCLRVNTPGEANVILGPGSASAGWKAHQIPKGKPGTLYLDAPGADTPRLARAWHVTDQMVARTARAYADWCTRLDPDSEQAVAAPAPRPTMAGTRPAAPVVADGDTSAPAGERGDPLEALLDALAVAGERGAKVAELAAAVGMRKTWVYDRLGELEAARRVVRVGQGRWRPEGGCNHAE